ncbi:MAG: ABC transporter permease [Waddliaceae bacterium]
MRLRALKILISGCLTAVFLLCLMFALSQWVPIDPTLTLVGDAASAESYQQAREMLGVDLPLWKKIAHYFSKLLHGNLGVSVMTSNPVVDDLLRVFPATFELAALSLAIGIIGGVPIGVMAAWHPRSFWNVLVQWQAILYSVPTFVLSIAALLVFYVKLQWVEGPGRVDILHSDYPSPTGCLFLDSALAGDWDVFINGWKHIVLPASILGLFTMASLSRMTRSLMTEQLSQPYILTATLKGLSPAKILWKHALRNVSLPLLAIVMTIFSSLLEGAVIVETVFAWPGLGRYLTQSLILLDHHAFLGATLLIGMMFIGLTLILDLLSVVIDPRGYQ